MIISSRFNRFFHSAVLTDLFNKSYKLKFENLVDTRTNQLFTIEKYEDYQDMDDLKQLLKVLNLDYAVDEEKDKKISTSCCFLCGFLSKKRKTQWCMDDII